MRRAYGLAFSLLPLLAHAEVLDKEFSLPTVAAWSLCGAIAVAFAARFRPWLLTLLVPVIGGFFYAHLSEFFVPYVGSAIVAEGGASYLFASWGGLVLVIGACGVGFLWRSRCVTPST